MSDDDDFDELPPISVNSSSSDSRSFIMPGAGEVAEARARAAHCERQLLLLRAEHEAAVTASTARAGAGPVGIAHHSDSSGSEGEAALAAAVAALRVKRAAVTAPDHATLLTLAVEAAGEHAPPWLQRYLHAVERGSEAGRRRLAERTLAELSAAARAAEEWSREDALGAALWALTAAAAPSAPPSRLHLARLAHRLLDDILTEDQMEAMVCALEVAVCTWSGARVEVCDVLRGGGDVCRGVACRLLAGGGSGGAREGAPAEQYAALQLVGRVLAGGGGGGGAPTGDLARRLDTLAPKHSHPTPDELKVLVAASKIRVLFDIGR